jgi:bacteriocin biosynthesis cyclodehydratase domain-containing protein
VLETGPSNALDYYLENLVGQGGRAGEAAKRPMRIKIIGDPALRTLLHRQISEDGADLAVESVPDDDAALRVLGDPDMSWLADGLEFAERMQAFESWRDHFLVVVQQVIQPHQFGIINRVCLALGTPWLHAAFDGPFLFVGPTIVPNRTACYRCFETRVGMNLRESASYLRYKATVAEGRCRHGRLPAEGILGAMLCSHAAWEAMNYVTTRNAFTAGKVLSIYVPTMEFVFNDVLRVSGCPDCGSLPERDDRELYFDLRTVLKNLSNVTPVGT